MLEQLLAELAAKAQELAEKARAEGVEEGKLLAVSEEFKAQLKKVGADEKEAELKDKILALFAPPVEAAPAPVEPAA